MTKIENITNVLLSLEARMMVKDQSQEDFDSLVSAHLAWVDLYHQAKQEAE